MIIRFKNLLCSDMVAVLEGKEERSETNTSNATKINDLPLSIVLQSYENRCEKLIGYHVFINFEKTNNISVFFKEKIPALAFESFLIDTIRSQPDYIEFDVLEHGAV
jgi:hypothetical protein